VGRRAADAVLAGVDLMGLSPVRTAPWDDAGDRVVLRRPRPERGLRHALEWVGWWLAPRRLRLDPIGSLAWRQLDGVTAAGAVAAALRERFGQAAEPAEQRLGTLLRMLRRDGFVAFPPWDELSPPGP